VNAVTTSADALECFRVAWYHELEGHGQEPTDFSKQAFYERLYGRSYTLMTKLEERSLQACECDDKWCASEVAKDLFALVERHSTAAASSEQLQAMKQPRKKLINCVIVRGVDPSGSLLA